MFNQIEKIMPKKKFRILLLVIVITASAFTYFFYNYSLDISGMYKIGRDELLSSASIYNKPVVYIGVISRYPPNIIYRGYQPVLDYLSQKTNYRFELKLSSDYNEAVQMLIKKETAAAFLGSYVYVNAHKQYGVIPILKPLNEDFEPYSRSVLITNKSSKLFSVKDLKGKRLALPSKESFSGNWLIKYEFAKYNLRVSDIADIQHFPHHQSVIYQVSKGYFDAGVTREFLVKNMQNNDGIRIILYSDKIPTSPIVVAQDHDKEIVEAIKNTLLEINPSNPDRADITKNWDNEFIYGFEQASDSDYEFIRMISE